MEGPRFSLLVGDALKKNVYRALLMFKELHRKQRLDIS